MNTIMRWWKRVWGKMLFWIARYRTPEGVYYINGPDTLPPPLPREEEESIMEAIRN